ncbi:MAG: helix-turn-helix transcriptional regulator [Pseudomonadota bacterium]
MKARDIIARNIRQRRAELDLSQDELGARAQSSGNYIGMIERSEVSVSIDMLEDIAAVLDMALRDMVDERWSAGPGAA